MNTASFPLKYAECNQELSSISASMKPCRELLELEQFGRITGCQSTNHDQCYGDLWQCAKCGKTVCYAEGTDDDPELCDDCWVLKHHIPTLLNLEKP